MGNLLLNSLEIRNFRGFSHLQIERLGRVNLIVGKNNIGKSSLLEALQLYARRGAPALIWEMLDARDESRYSPRLRDKDRNLSASRPMDRSMDVEDRLLALKYLFYGRKDIKMNSAAIQIGPVNSQDEILSIAVEWYTEEFDTQNRVRRRVLLPDEYDMVDDPEPRFTIQVGERQKSNYPLNPSVVRLEKSELKEINCIYRSANGLSGEQVSKLWDRVTLTSLEKEVLSSLRIVAPGIEDLSLVGDSISLKGLSPSLGERLPIVKMVGIDEPLPLRSLGDGIQRVLGIALALANAKDGLLLIDEIENGVHHSVQQELWELVFRLTLHLNVQVFATTHNWDCIEAFQKAAQKASQEEAILIRLGIKKDEVVAILYDKEELGVATRQQIEVR